jgi:hypothetical protein
MSRLRQPLPDCLIVSPSSANGLGAAAHLAGGQALQQHAEVLAGAARGRQSTDLPGDGVEIGADPQLAAVAATSRYRSAR